MLRGVRGAITVDSDTKEEILARTAELLEAIIAANGILPADIGAAIFSSTPDLTAAFPATAARWLGWTEVPLFGAQEIGCNDGIPRCIRVLLLWNTDKPQSGITHVYLRGAVALRPDIAAARAAN